MRSITDVFLIINYGSLPDWLTLVATLGTLYIANRALHTWRKEKLHDVGIEMLAASRRAMDFVAHLRAPFNHPGEIDPQLEKDYLKNNGVKNYHSDAYLIFHSKISRQMDFYNSLFELREKAWANYGEDHIFYKFYDKVIAVLTTMAYRHRDCLILWDQKNDMPTAEFNKRLTELTTFLYAVVTVPDKVGNDIENLHVQLVEQRKKAP